MQWQIQGRGPEDPLFSDQSKAGRAEKMFGGDSSPPFI